MDTNVVRTGLRFGDWFRGARFKGDACSRIRATQRTHDKPRSRYFNGPAMLVWLAAFGLPALCEDGFAQLCFSEIDVLNSNATTDWASDEFPQVATDGAGHWVALWTAYGDDNGTGSDHDILVARSTDSGATWTDPEPLNTNAATDAGRDYGPQVTTDGAGHWVAVWQSQNDLGGTIRNDEDILVACSTDNGATWTDPEPLNTNAATDWYSDTYPQVTTDGTGHWVAVWDCDGGLGGVLGIDTDILVARSTDNGATWTDPAALGRMGVA